MFEITVFASYTTRAKMLGAVGETRTLINMALDHARLPVAPRQHCGKFFADGESRTLNLLILNQAPLPIGLRRREEW